MCAIQKVLALSVSLIFIQLIAMDRSLIQRKDVDGALSEEIKKESTVIVYLNTEIENKIKQEGSGILLKEVTHNDLVAILKKSGSIKEDINEEDIVFLNRITIDNESIEFDAFSTKDIEQI